MKESAFRLRRGDDLKKAIADSCKEKTAVVLSAVGCLSHVSLRMAKGKDFLEKDGDFEIVSLTGTVTKGRAHLHISVSDETGRVTGGHLCEGSIVNTTCEVILGILEDYDAERSYDPSTGYDEIVFVKKS
ncbi:MAG: DNA-binding protein [Erysipelotrichaceae bacterium]|nr:DNA-binding protein [Erysipelotrichaceae bacterium]